MNRLQAVLGAAMLVVPVVGGSAVAGGTAADLGTQTNGSVFASERTGLRYDDLDMSRADDRMRLAARLDRAAADVCGRGLDRVHPTLAQAAAQCKRETIAETRAQIDRRMAARGGHGAGGI
ncbi:MAG: UrcA family protein, partial [Rhizorhabdus sp.]